MSEETPTNAGSGRQSSRGQRNARRRGHASRRGPLATAVPEGYLAVGRVITAHGTRGEVSVDPFTDFPEERFAAGNSMLLGEDMEEAEIATARPHKGRMLVRFGHVTNRDDAEALRGSWIYIAEEDAAELDEDTYYIHQIVGLTAQTGDGQILGTVQDVLFTGANEVYVVKPAAGVNEGREILLPAIGEVIAAVDIEGGRLVINLLPGILNPEEE